MRIKQIIDQLADETSKEEKEEVKVTFRQLVLRLGLDISKLAEKLDVSPQSVYRWKRAERWISSENFLKLHQLFDTHDADSEEADQQSDLNTIIKKGSIVFYEEEIEKLNDDPHLHRIWLISSTDFLNATEDNVRKDTMDLLTRPDAKGNGVTMFYIFPERSLARKNYEYFTELLQEDFKELVEEAKRSHKAIPQLYGHIYGIGIKAEKKFMPGFLDGVIAGIWQLDDSMRTLKGYLCMPVSSEFGTNRPPHMWVSVPDLAQKWLKQSLRLLTESVEDEIKCCKFDSGIESHICSKCFALP